MSATLRLSCTVVNSTRSIVIVTTYIGFITDVTVMSDDGYVFIVKKE